jgi:hypothetical protein
MKEFIYNEHGVCENEILTTYKCVYKYEASIGVAIVECGKWSYCIRFQGHQQGWSEPLLNHAQYNVYNTQEEAFEAGLNRLLSQIKHNNDFRKYDRIIQMLEEELCPVVESQLSLF